MCVCIYIYIYIYTCIFIQVLKIIRHTYICKIVSIFFDPLIFTATIYRHPQVGHLFYFIQTYTYKYIYVYMYR